MIPSPSNLFINSTFYRAEVFNFNDVSFVHFSFYVLSEKPPSCKDTLSHFLEELRNSGLRSVLN